MCYARMSKVAKLHRTFAARRAGLGLLFLKSGLIRLVGDVLKRHMMRELVPGVLIC